MSRKAARLKWHMVRRRRDDPAFLRRNLVAGLEAEAALEVDLVLTADRHFVCLHDLTLDAETTGTGPVASARRTDLDAVARGHSADMARRRYLSHETPEGKNWVDRLGIAGVEGFTMAGENVGLTTKPDPNGEILRGWIHSKVHLDNLIAAPFNSTGLGIARSADGTLYYTQLYLHFPRD